jgi:hypothetical protein
VERGMSRQERWLPVAGYGGAYEVSDLGRVRSNGRLVSRSNGTSYWLPGRILKSPAGSSGYSTVDLYIGGANKIMHVHRMVLEAFVGPCPEGMQALHDNDVKSDNRLSNLAWGTPSQNGYDRYRNGFVVHHSLKTECLRGHLLQEPNLVECILREGRRSCKACNYGWKKTLPWEQRLARVDLKYRQLTGLEPNLSAVGRRDPRFAEHGAT